MNADTIVAIATPPGMGGIGVVRLSGTEALVIAGKLTSPAESATDALPDRHACYCRILDPESSREIDRAVVTFFRGPRSYTGEDVIEFSCHGSVPVLRRLVAACVGLGARPAGPGEFTLRAVLNGRMDLTQAEAVNRLIHARTFVQAEQAVRQLEGGVARHVHDIEEHLFSVIAQMEAEVDFAEENESFLHRHVAQATVLDLRRDIESLVGGFRLANLMRDGAVVVLAGRANAGKSTLFNALLREERSIVDARPGTTRDYIAESLEIEGIPVRLIDTAGLRGAGEEIEIEGMRRSRGLIETADLVVLVTVAGEKHADEEESILRALAARETPVIMVRNKVDLLAAGLGCDGLGLSARSGDGIDRLRAEIARALGLDEIAREKDLVTELRQQQLFKRAAERVSAAAEAFSAGIPDEVILEELNGAMDALGEITGRGGTEEILGRIFARFCIGK